MTGLARVGGCERTGAVRPRWAEFPEEGGENVNRRRGVPKVAAWALPALVACALGLGGLVLVNVVVSIPTAGHGYRRSALPKPTPRCPARTGQKMSGRPASLPCVTAAHDGPAGPSAEELMLYRPWPRVYSAHGVEARIEGDGST